MRYLIVTRAGEIYRLRFDREGEDLFLHHKAPGHFYSVAGYSEARVLKWLDERSFTYYWEDSDD